MYACRFRHQILIGLAALTSLTLGLITAVLPEDDVATQPVLESSQVTAQNQNCRWDFKGIRYCLDDGKTHIFTIDLAEPSLRFDVVLAHNVDTVNVPGWRGGQPVADIVKSFAGSNLALAINGDYIASNGTHGPEGFTVRQGQRFDGSRSIPIDCDCNEVVRNSMAISRSRPHRIDIGVRTAAEIGDAKRYQACRAQRIFQPCENALLNGPSDPRQDLLQDRFYTVMGGGPIIVRDGQPIPIDQACRNEGGFGGPDWCNPESEKTATPARKVELQMNAAAGVDARGQKLILVLTEARFPNEVAPLLIQEGAASGIRFDGSRSTQGWYGTKDDGQSLTANRRPIGNALLVYADRRRTYDAVIVRAPSVMQVNSGAYFQAEVEIKNTGSATWEADQYALVNVNNNPLGVNPRLPLAERKFPDQTARWVLRMKAPPTIGPSRSEWQLKGGDQAVGPVVSIQVVVIGVPDLGEIIRREINKLLEQFKQWLEDLRRQLEEAIRREIEKLVEQLRQELQELLRREIERLLRELCGGAALILPVIGIVLALRRRGGMR